MDHIPVLVCEHLELDMSRLDKVFLNKYRRITKCRFGHAHSRADRILEACFIVDYLHPYSAATSTCLHDDRVADLFSYLPCFIRLLHPTRGTRYNRDSRFPHHLFALDLGSHCPDRPPGRPYKRDPFICASFCEMVILGKESVSRMDRFTPGFFCDINNPLDIQVALGGRGLPHEKCLISVFDVKGILISI